MLIFLGVHLTYTFPAIGLLSLIARPLLCRSDVLKMSLVSAATLTYIYLWGCYANFNGLLKYPQKNALASIGHVSLAAQTILTLLWSSFCFRWSTSCLNFNFDKPTYHLIRWVPISLLSVVTAVGYALVISGQNAMYLGSILCWSCPTIAFMWYGAGNFVVKRIKPSIVAIAVPTLYLYWADRISDPKGYVLRGNEKTRLNVFALRDLPLEEAFFYFVVNAQVVLAVNCYDKASGMMEAYTLEFPRQFSYSLAYVSQLFSAFMTSEYSMPAGVVDDIRTCFNVLKNESTTFATAVLLFQGGIRLDMVILYAFGRVTDEMFDNDVDPRKKQRDLELCYEYVNEIFADRKNRFHVKREPEAVKLDWAKYESQLSDTEIATFRALARISFYLPSAPLIELIDIYQWDVDDKGIKTEVDLMTYTDNVAGITALTVCIIMYRDYNDKYFDIVENGKKEVMIKKAYEMGQAIQFVNISRDIVKDSIQLGRCYIPIEYMDDADNDIRALRQDKDPRSLGETKLKKYANKLIGLTHKFQSGSEGFFRSLPAESRGLIMALVDIYHGYIPAIQSSPNYPSNAKLSRWNMIKIGLHTLYVKSLQYGM